MIEQTIPIIQLALIWWEFLTTPAPITALPGEAEYLVGDTFIVESTKSEVMITEGQLIVCTTILELVTS